MPEPERDPERDPADTISEERAARRFHQVRRLEASIAKIDGRIETAKTKLGALKTEREAFVASLLAAARDEGDLPLFDLD